MEMEKLLLVTMFGVVIMVQAFGIINGCFLEEKAALLEFKSTYFNASVLPSWVEDDPRKNNCCQWERVTCDATSGHVIHLDLHWVQTDMQTCADNNIYILNWSLFQTFKELRTLDLSSNCIHGFIWNADYMNLAALETLDLSYNSVNISIMESLSALTSLKNLFLAENKLFGPLPTKELSLQRNLELLDLSYNGLSSPLTTQDAKAFLKLKKLKMLNLRSNEFDKGVLNSFLGLPALKSLILQDEATSRSRPLWQLYYRKIRSMPWQFDLSSGS
ncbi:hypothetical protein PIB30_005554 [Stylosanthes scabra]|uniref:Leucine-rich repeat-containing N-terminal plant-type domain-containing protein n=1 Tax=Stylosanthes scabra TaxID=79078 RepID=A0ABU6Q414_9FABA|nr:hypothetical protein [Stylosanthes scabra]